MPQYTLTYVDIKGRAEAIRLAFTIGNIPFKDDRLSYSEFFKQQKEGKFKFNQIPVLYIDGKQISQSKSILRYVGNQSQLYPKSELDQLIVDEGIDLIDDIWTLVAKAVDSKRSEQEKIEERTKLKNEILPRMLSYYDKQVVENQSGFYLKQQLTVADILCYVLIKWITEGGISHLPYDLNKHKGLVKLVQNIEAIPEVQKWNSLHNNNIKKSNNNSSTK